MYDPVSVQHLVQGLRRDEIDSKFWNSRSFRDMNIPLHGSDVILRTQCFHDVRDLFGSESDSGFLENKDETIHVRWR